MIQVRLSNGTLIEYLGIQEAVAYLKRQATQILQELRGIREEDIEQAYAILDQAILDISTFA